MENTNLSIVIVNWNSAKLLVECLDLIYQGAPRPAWKITIVDNNSTDDSVKLLKEQYPGVHIIENRDNKGFAAASNQGISAYASRYFLLLNPDTLIKPESIQEMVEFMDSHPNIGISGPMTFFPDGRLQISWSWASRLSSAILRSKPPTGQSCLDVDLISGAIMFIRSEVIESIGLLDESIFMYAEDLDFCFRAKKAGWQVVLNSEIAAVHAQGKSTPWTIQRTAAKQLVNVRRVYLRHYGLFRTKLYFTLLFLGTLIRVAYYRLLLFRRSKNEIENEYQWYLAKLLTILNSSHVDRYN